MLDLDVSSEEQRYYIALLLDIYGGLLTNKQKESLELYFQEDLSLSEISEIKGISRQGVLDNIKNGVKALNKADQKLKILDKIRKYENRLTEIAKIITNADIDIKTRQEILNIIGDN